MNSKLLHGYIAKLLRKKQNKINRSAQAQYNNTSIYQYNKGFSLIELLVVIVILGILSSFVTYTMVGRQKQARDAQRKSDMQTFKKAMEAAKTDCRNASYYPKIDPVVDDDNARYFYTINYFIDANLKYLPSRVDDPKFDGASLGTTYFLAVGSLAGQHCPTATAPPVSNAQDATESWVARAKLETTNDPESNKSRLNCQNAIDEVKKNLSENVFGNGDPTTGDGYFYVCSN